MPIYEEYKNEPFQNRREVIFNDISEFIYFVQKTNYYNGSIISDKCFNVVNNALSLYGNEHYGDRLSGIAKFYSFEYDNFIRVKNNIMDEIEILMNRDINDDGKIEAVRNIKNKTYLYLTVKEGTYIV